MGLLMEFDKDVRAGLASVLQSVSSGLCDVYEVSEQKIMKIDAEELAKVPDGVHQVLAMLYVLKELLLEQDAAFSASLIGEIVLRIQPVVFRHLGIRLVSEADLVSGMTDDLKGLVN